MKNIQTKKYLTEEKNKKPSDSKNTKQSKDSEQQSTSSENGQTEEKKPLSATEIKEKITAFIKQACASGSDAVIASTIDNLTLGNFREALCEIAKEQYFDKMSEKDLEVTYQKLQSSPSFIKAKREKDFSNRKDDNTNTEIDESSVKTNIIFYSKNDDQNLLKTLNDVVIEIQKAADKEQKEREELESKVQSMKLKNVGDAEIEGFGPVIYEMIKGGKSKEEIEKYIEETRKVVKESYNQKLLSLKNQKLLTEGNIYITEHEKNCLLLESIVFEESFKEYIAYKLLFEDKEPSFLDKTLEKFRKSKTWKGIKIVAKGLGNTLKGYAQGFYSLLPEKVRKKIEHLTEKAIEAYKSGALAPILKIASIGTLILTGAWGIGLIIATFSLIERYGPRIKATMDKCWATFANSKGVVARMDFNIKNNPELTYSARFYVKDLAWRVLNTSNQSKQPSQNFVKEILSKPKCKEFMELANKVWDPVFSPDKGGEVDFGELLSQSQELKLDKKQIKLLTDFKNAYPKLKVAFNKPKIDTRTQKI